MTGGSSMSLRVLVVHSVRSGSVASTLVAARVFSGVLPNVGQEAVETVGTGAGLGEVTGARVVAGGVVWLVDLNQPANTPTAPMTKSAIATAAASAPILRRRIWALRLVRRCGGGVAIGRSPWLGTLGSTKVIDARAA